MMPFSCLHVSFQGDDEQNDSDRSDFIGTWHTWRCSVLEVLLIALIGHFMLFILHLHL